MKIHKAYKTRIYPTVKQQKMLTNHFGCARFIYNYFLQQKIDQYKRTRKSLSHIEMSRELTKMKKKKEFEWLGDVSRQCLAKSLADLDFAFNKFFRGKADFPKHKKKHHKQSFRINAPFCQIKENGVQIPLIGVLKCSLDGLPEDYKLISMTISKDPTSKCFVAVSFETDIPNPVVNENKPIIGLDFGLKTFITTSEGQKIEHIQSFRREEKRLKKIDRRLARRKKGSNRRRTTKKKRALLCEKIRNRRSDFLHKLSSKMISENQAIYLEDLNLKGMMGRFGKGIGDAGWSEFTRQLEYKGQWYGCEVRKIDRFFPSSKICSYCNYINDDLTLKDRGWVCPSCDAHHDRDVNAAINVLTYGRAGRNVVGKPTKTDGESRACKDAPRTAKPRIR